MAEPAPDRLVADVGATHARFAAVRAGRLAGEVITLPTAAFADAESLIHAARDRLPLTAMTGGCFAVAGPVVNGRVAVTNGKLSFDAAELSVKLGAPIRLINDFHALAMALPALTRLQAIGGDPRAARERAVRAVLGPGSGLGMSVLLPEGSAGWRVLPSEGGHADLAPGNHLEQELLSLLLMEHRSVCWETVLSGAGLVRLYRAVSRLWGLPVETIPAEEVSRRGVNADDPVCHQTLELFFGLLGAAAGNLALTVCARAVYIGGGIVPQLKDFAPASPLRRRFEERAELAELLTDVPLLLILDEHPGLVGAALCLNE